ncbi:MAG: hypothetical protein ABI305_02410 [Tepidiformaceae bacterium]
MTAAASSLPHPIVRPATIAWAVGVVVIVSIANFFLPLIPNTGDIPPAAIVTGDIVAAGSIVLCLPLWQCKRWAAIAITVLNGFNALASIAGLVEPDTGTVVVVILTGMVLTIVTILLMWHPDSRRAYRAR